MWLPEIELHLGHTALSPRGTVRRLNRARSPAERLHFASKYRLARQMLELCASSSRQKRLFTYISISGTHRPACSNTSGAGLACYLSRQTQRKLNGLRIEQYDLANGTGGMSMSTYLLRMVRRRRIWSATCSPVAQQAPLRCPRVGMRRHYRDHLRCTLSVRISPCAAQALQWYARRWNCEIDNFYLKQRLASATFVSNPTKPSTSSAPSFI